MKFKSEFLNILNQRGFINQLTDNINLDKYLLNKNCSAYIGFDCTAPSLHVGSLMQIMMLRWFQKCGNNPIVLVGGGTTKVGDPSGKDNSRPMLNHELINNNKDSLKITFSRYLNFENGSNRAYMVDNKDWLDNLNYISFLRENGSFFSVNKMISLESIKLRLDREQNLSFLEFNYPIFQAYDFFVLNKKFNCRIQMGGSDQWGNIVNGIDLIRKKTSSLSFGITSPLLTTSSGSKMGKSEKGAIWLLESMLPHYDFWQFWRNTEDSDVIKFLKLFTEIDLDEIEKLSNLSGSEINEAKILLANEVTKLCRGEEAAISSHKIAQDTFHRKKVNTNLPTIEISAEKINLIELIRMFDFCKSNSEVRRVIRGKGIKINDKLIVNEDHNILKNEFYEPLKISVGKKKHGVLIFK